MWHFNFRGPDVERLVAGRERILLDRFYNELSANPGGIDEQTRDHYAALYARPGAIHNAFSGQFAAFAQDAEDNKALFAKVGKLPMPVLAVGGDHSYGAAMKTELEYVASNVQGGGHRQLRATGSWRSSRSRPSPCSSRSSRRHDGQGTAQRLAVDTPRSVCRSATIGSTPAARRAGR